MHVTREDLQRLVDQPLGAPHLQAEADSGLIQKGHAKPTPELKETIKRTAKTWLPQGRYSPVRAPCNEPAAVQTDIEDAVEQAGGKRGRKAGAA